MRAIKPKMIISLYVLSTFVFMSCNTGGDVAADKVLYGGKIYTMNPGQPTVEAVACKDGKIIYAGGMDGLSKFRSDKTGEIDLKGATVFPGFIDVHLRLEDVGRSTMQLNLEGTKSKEEIYKLVISRAIELRKDLESEEKDIWVTGSGWDQNDWENQEFPSFADLPSVNPVILMRIDGQTAWLNERALRIAEIGKSTPDPPGGKILRDKYGYPNGILLNSAVKLVESRIPEYSEEQRKLWLTKGMEQCLELGLTGIHNFGVDPDEFALLQEMNRQKELTLRIYPVLECKYRSWIAENIKNGPYGEPWDFLRLRAVKMFVDGPMGSRAAALFEPYNDEPGHCGLIEANEDTLLRHVKRSLEAGFQVCAYAVGDRGSKLALDIYEKVLSQVPVEDHRLRLEHAQLLAEKDFARIGKMNVIPTIFPSQATSDMYWAEDRLGKDRIKRAYAWRTILSNTEHYACGSEAPVESPNPLWSIYAAVTRQDHKGWPEGGWYAEQKMTREEVIKGYTIEAAYAEFAEKYKGSIETGKLADFTILDKDIFEIESAELLQTQVKYTIIAGKIAYDDSMK
ncbi:MAG: amidohydrolase [Candidatus Electryonea clarkiae]|nr:amidohydrolase [Candidatus Electryonea clarkiae]MDP8287652.1 amidohydrolase [Candidatus Electryonea clarkiae]